MTAADLLELVKKLPTPERVRFARAVLGLVEKELRGPKKPARAAPARESARRRKMAAAAAALRRDYEADPDLTAFTSLDGEDFHA